jgi:hypothetical protein
MNQKNAFPLLPEEGWREAPGWSPVPTTRAPNS